MHVVQMLHNPAVRDFVSLGNGYTVLALQVSAALVGRTLASLALERKFDLRLLGVMRRKDFLGTAGADFALAADDRVIVLGTRTNLRRFGDSI